MDDLNENLRKSRSHSDLENLLKNIKGPYLQKEHIKEIIEKNNGSDVEGILRDIHFAIKELNLR